MERKYRREEDRGMVNTYNLYNIIKRALDIVLSLCALLILLPILIIIAILIKIDSKGPIIYRHVRVGLNHKSFYIYKFRSMTTEYKNFQEFYQTLSKEQKEEWDNNFKLKNDPRITKMGRILRKTSLDELPQLVNILKGDMSIVGPRPIIEEELEWYGNNVDKLLSVRPGLTGYWASHGRSNVEYPKRCNLELFYVDNKSILLDLSIIYKTIFSVVKSEGAK
jgi:lipopolysaccharide/colanic/teichoic acid biosynthesis glycosyltransferase